jgi:predicted DCC family thiol-disulfide oxidoreductase YuxK
VSGVLAWDRHGRLAPRAIQSPEGGALLSDLDPEQRLASVHLVAPGGERLSGGGVAAPLLRLLPGGAVPAFGFARLPRLTDRVYGWVADHRSQLSRAVPRGAKRRASARVSRSEGAGGMGGPARMRLPNTAHTSRPWRIHELMGDFRLEDVWALPTPGGPDDFPRLVQAIIAGDPEHDSSRAAGALWAIRWKLGELFGWDDPETGLGSRVPTLRDRLPADLRDAPSGPDFDTLPFSPLYLLDDEWAAEIANKTVHGVMHLGWVPDASGGYHGEMAVYVKPNGLFGSAYMAAIKPFRHLIVYPPMIRRIEREWRAQAGAQRPNSA